MIEDIVHCECEYYRGYQLDSISKYELNDEEKRILDNACELVDNKWSLRTLSRNCCDSKSKLSKDFKTTLRRISYELYRVVQRQLSENKRKYFK